MRFIFYIILLFPFLCTAQEKTNTQTVSSKQVNNSGNNPVPTIITYDIIISLTAANTDNIANSIKASIASDTSGLIYKGYCKSQQCLVLKVVKTKFGTKQAVTDYLIQHFGSAVSGYKNIAVKDFYKGCTFADQNEYHYFKTTYK